MKRDYQKEAEEFVEKLKPLATDSKRGERAALKRYWSAGTKTYAYPVLGGLFAIGNKPKEITAALFAVHPAHQRLPSFGTTCHRIAGNNRDTFEPHFRRLLSSETLDDLASQLHRLVKRAERADIPVNYLQLYQDLGCWRFRADNIKTNWAKDFWQAPDPIKAEEEAINS